MTDQEGIRMGIIEAMFELLRVAIIYDWIDSWGGVERILLNLHEIFPSAPFYTSYFDQKGAEWATGLKIVPSFLQKFPSAIKSDRLLSVPFYPYAFESFDFSSFDLVISVTSSFAKAIITKPGTLHICYLLTPTRFIWVNPGIYIKNNIGKKIITPYVNYLSRWDYVASTRPDHVISISDTVKERCLKYYKRKSEVIYPPFDVEYWQNIKNVILGRSEATTPESDSGLRTSFVARMTLKNKKFFLIVSRLEPYKRVDLAIDVFNKRPELTLLIVGKGREENSLRRKAAKNIYFFENISDKELAALYKSAQALIMPQQEDFGYTALEAQFFGCPVIAYGKGGAKETVVDGKTGIFFSRQSGISLAGAVERFAKISYNLKANVAKFGVGQAEKFAKVSFKNNFFEFLNSKL